MAVYGRLAVIEAGEGGIEPLLPEMQHAATVVEKASGVLRAKGWMGFPFRSGPPTPEGPDLRLVALLALGEQQDALDEAVTSATGAVDDVARYDVLGACVKAAGEGWGFPVPTDDVTPLDHAEPVFVVITGDLHPEYVENFSIAGGDAVAHAEAQPGYLGGCALVTNGLDITSVSCWAEARDARRYAFGEGGHADAMNADRSGGWHDRSTELFMTFRVLDARGSLLGRTPFVGGA